MEEEKKKKEAHLRSRLVVLSSALQVTERNVTLDRGVAVVSLYYVSAFNNWVGLYKRQNCFEWLFNELMVLHL